MNIQKRHWYRFLVFAFLSFVIWCIFTLPQFAFVNLSVSRGQALQIAQDYLREEAGVDPATYRHAVVFATKGSADQYLQKAIGFDEELKFLKKHDFELFFWKIRFYREKRVEQYYVTLSAATGEVTAFRHKIPSTTARPHRTQEESKALAIDLLKEKFDFDPEAYILHADHSKKFDNRIDYSFTWEKKGVFVRWTEKENKGGGLLLTGARVSGDEILSFNKHRFKVPGPFKRHMSRKKNFGRNMAVVFRIFFFSLLTASIFFVVVRRNNLVMHTTKRFCITITAFVFLLNVASFFNHFEGVFYHYSTVSSFSSYLWRVIVEFLLDTFIVTISILMPCLAGESLRYEAYPEKPRSSFLHYIVSTFYSRSVFQAVLLGYLTAMIMIGIQSAAFEIGQNFLGVWVEYTWMAQLSASYLPFLTAFVIGFNASATEEIAFRMFSISFGKKFLKSTMLAVLFAAVIWGYGHSTYPVYPMWFRGLEVTCLGIFLSYVYLRFGIIPVLVAHYLFDVFWGCSAYLLGQSTSYHFFSSVFVLFLPLMLGLYAYWRNQPEEERPMQWKLSPHQIYNLEVLKHYLLNKGFPPGKTKEQVKKDIVAHGWDIGVVEIALEELWDKSA